MPARQPPFPSDPRVPQPMLAARRVPAPALRARVSPWAPLLRIAPVIILLIGVLLPVEVRVNLAGQTLYAYRIGWLVCAPWIMFEILRGRFQFRFVDALVVLFALWTAFAFAVVEGLARGLPAGLAVALDTLMPYLITRHVIRTPNDFRLMLIVLAPPALLIGVFMAAEAITHQRYIRSAAEAVFGAIGAAEYGDTAPRVGGIDNRYGMARAMGPFSHPILAGLFFAGLLPLYYFSRLRGWPLLVGLASGIGVVFALSSAPLFGVAVFAMLAVYDKLRRLFTFLNWPMFISIALAVLLALHLISNRGLISVLIGFTMNPGTGYYRLLIWEFGTKIVERNPWFGTAYAPFEGLAWMSDSVDTIWLAIAIRNGLPAAIFFGLAVVIAIIGLALAASRVERDHQSILIGLAITLVIFFVLGFTVSFFGGLVVWFAMLVAIATTLGQLVAPRQVQQAPMIRVRRPA